MADKGLDRHSPMRAGEDTVDLIGVICVVVAVEGSLPFKGGKFPPFYSQIKATLNNTFTIYIFIYNVSLDSWKYSSHNINSKSS